MCKVVELRDALLAPVDEPAPLGDLLQQLARDALVEPEAYCRKTFIPGEGE
jgi:hypothetical protein